MTGHPSTFQRAKRALEDLDGEATSKEVSDKTRELYPQGEIVEGQVSYLFMRDDDVELVETNPERIWRLNGDHADPDDRQDDEDSLVDELEEGADPAELDDIARHDDETNGHNTHRTPSFFDDIVELLLAETYQSSDEIARKLDITPNAAGARCSRDPRIAKARGHWRIRRPKDVDDAWDVTDWPRVSDEGPDARRLEHEWPCPFKGCTETIDWVPAIEVHANSACTEEQQRALEDDDEADRQDNEEHDVDEDLEDDVDELLELVKEHEPIRTTDLARELDVSNSSAAMQCVHHDQIERDHRAGETYTFWRLATDDELVDQDEEPHDNVDDEAPSPTPDLESSPQGEGESASKPPPSVAHDAEDGRELDQFETDQLRQLQRFRLDLVETLVESLDASNDLEYLARLALEGVLEERPVEDVVAEYLDETNMLTTLLIKTEVYAP